MRYLLTPYAIAQLLTSIVASLVAGFVWKRRKSRGGWPLFLLFIAIAEWALANGFESAAVPLDLKIFWSKISYIGSQSSPVLILLFALQYTGKGGRVTPLSTGLLFIVPSAIMFLAGTNDVHHLIWTGFQPGPEGTNSLIYLHGPAFWLAMAYVFILVAISTGLLIISSVRSQAIYRKQTVIVFIASLIPWMGALVYLFNLNPFPGLDTISFSFLFTGLILVWGMTRRGLLEIVPIAHELVVGNIDDAILVVDKNMRVVDINPAAEALLSKNARTVIGQALNTAVSFWDQIEEKFTTDLPEQVEIPYFEKFLNIRISQLKDHQDRFIGWAIILEDISNRKRIEDELIDVNQRLVTQLEEIRALQDQLREQAVRDSLTGLFNRRYLDYTLPRELAHAARKEYPLSIIMMDIDHFKLVNDKFGHRTGDEVIAAMGKLLHGKTRESDCVCRYGGDEFLLVMPDMSQEHALQRADDWREGIKALVFEVNDQKIQITISIGISTFPDNGRDIDRLLKAADDAMYQAKDKGRDQTVVAK